MLNKWLYTRFTLSHDYVFKANSSHIAQCAIIEYVVPCKRRHHTIAHMSIMCMCRVTHLKAQTFFFVLNVDFTTLVLTIPCAKNWVMLYKDVDMEIQVGIF